MKTITFLLFIITVTLHGQNKLLSTVSEYSDGSTWINSYGSNYEYDSNNNLIFETEFFWDNLENNWKNSYTINYTYNANNKVTSETDKKWNILTEQFENEYRATYTYNGNGNIIEWKEEEWDNGSWENKYKTTFIYDNNRIEASEDYYWIGGEWNLQERYNLSYNGNNRVSSIIIQTSMDNSISWTTDGRDVFTYDVNNKLAEKSFQKWNGITYVENEKIEYELDTSFNRIKETYTYDGGSNENIYYYDMTELMSNYAHPFKDKTGLDFILDDFPFYNKIESYTSGTNYRTTANYNSQIVLGINDSITTKKDIRLIVDSVSSDVTILNSDGTRNSVEIYNTLGSNVFASKENKFNISFLKTGVYFVNITNDDGSVLTKKIHKR
ncbi:T9SS type A sorting domain-containing protein [Mariniflexile sp.]|uniref:T9SS type A sorting domain-containing protein n=1 Tax=Mariniflexile sp. TaxID=1979402 RepID=UPI003569AADE